MDDDKQFDAFCPSCGQRLERDDQFCPSCGASINASPSAGGQIPYQSSTTDYHGRLLAISVIAAVTAVLLLISGIYAFGSADSVINQLTSDPQWPSIQTQIIDRGMTVDQFFDVIRSTMNAIGIMFIIGALTGAVLAVCGFTKKMYILGLIACILMTVMTASTILGLIVGIIITYLYTTTKPEFT